MSHLHSTATWLLLSYYIMGVLQNAGTKGYT